MMIWNYLFYGQVSLIKIVKIVFIKNNDFEISEKNVKSWNRVRNSNYLLAKEDYRQGDITQKEFIS